MRKILKWVGILFAIFMVLGIIASIGSDSSSQNTTQTTSQTSVNTETKTATNTATNTNKPSLEVIEAKAERDEFGAIYIVGTVKNNTKKQYSYVQVEINLYDKNGNQLGSTLDNVNNLEPGGTWRFKAPVLEDGVASFKIKDVTGF